MWANMQVRTHALCSKPRIVGGYDVNNRNIQNKSLEHGQIYKLEPTHFVPKPE